MRPINLLAFNGCNTATNARLLPESVGTSAIDVRPGAGEFEPLNASVTVATVSSSPARKSLYRLGRDTVSDTNYWFSSSNVVNYLRGFDGSDPTERTYLTGEGSPKWTDNVIGLGGGPPYPQAYRELSVPAPSSAATVTLTVDGTGTQSTRFYVHTFVNDLGWESAPSPVSSGVLCRDGATLSISSLPAAPAGNYGITLRRIYRTQSGSTGDAEFFFLIEIPIGSTSTTDDARSLGDQLATTGWLPPPSNGFGLIGLWNQMMAMLSGKTVMFCEPGEPYAWPVKYDEPVQDTPVATAKWEQNLLVLTTGAPVVFQGSDPAGMSGVPLPAVHPCMSARGVVGYGYGVVWPSNEGLAYAGNDGQILLTGPTDTNPAGLITPAQWKAMTPSSMVAGRWQRFYVCAFSGSAPDGSSSHAFIIDPRNPSGTLVFLSSGFDACWYDELADQLFTVTAGNVQKFDAGSALSTASFTSKSFLQTAAVNYGWGRVDASSYPVTMKVYADGALKLTKTVADRNVFSMPSGFLASDWQIVVSGAAKIQAARLAVKAIDLKGL